MFRARKEHLDVLRIVMILVRIKIPDFKLFGCGEWICYIQLFKELNKESCSVKPGL